MSPFYVKNIGEALQINESEKLNNAPITNSQTTENELKMAEGETSMTSSVNEENQPIKSSNSTDVQLTADGKPSNDDASNSNNQSGIEKAEGGKLDTTTMKDCIREYVEKKLDTDKLNAEVPVPVPDEANAYTLDMANDCILALSYFFGLKQKYAYDSMQVVDFLNAAKSDQNSVGEDRKRRSFLLSAYETLNKALEKSKQPPQKSVLPRVQNQLKKSFIDIIVKTGILEEKSRKFGATEV